MEGGQSGTYLRQMRASLRHRDETKMNISARLSLLYYTGEEGHCDLAEILIFF